MHILWRTGYNSFLTFRYKLAAATCRHVGTQTMPLPLATPPESDQSEDGKQEAKQELPQAIVDALAAAKADILKLQQEKQVCQVFNCSSSLTALHEIV